MNRVCVCVCVCLCVYDREREREREKGRVGAYGSFVGVSRHVRRMKISLVSRRLAEDSLCRTRMSSIKDFEKVSRASITPLDVSVSL